MNKLYRKIFEELNTKGQAKTITIISNNKNVGKKFVLGTDITDINEEKMFKSLIEKVDLDAGTYSEVIDNEEIFVEEICGKPDLIICGGGHIALPLSKMGKMLGFNITVIDNRPEFACKDRFLEADNVICKEFHEAIDELDMHKNTYVVIVTRGHKDDRKCLENIIRKDNKYIGMIGSKAKVSSVFNSMIEEGYSEEDLKKVYTPIGLKICAQTPEEIAVSIFAEIIQVKNKKLSCSIEENIVYRMLFEKDDMILATIIDKRGSSPRGTGAKMLILSDGTCVGTIGGGSVENAVYERGKELIKEKKSSIETYDLSNSKASKLGMACGGTIRVLLEYIKSDI